MNAPIKQRDFIPVFARELQLTQFRNYGTLRLGLDQRHVVLCGDNGAGKTNLLEAISLLSPGRGLRRSKLEEIGKSGSSGSWSVYCELEGALGEVAIGTGLTETAAGLDTSRRVRINGTAAKTSDELLLHSRVVWLTPAMDGLFTGPGSERRKFLDRLVLAIDPAHGRRVANFEKLMRNRNRLLSEDQTDGAWLDALELQMAELGMAIACARTELISLLSSMIVRTHDPGSPFPDAIINIDGGMEQALDDLPASDVEDEYKDRLRSNRGMDKGAGRTLEGPHRSDLSVTHGPKGMAAGLCSTGEQKALLAGIVLSHARLTADINGFAPLLLLDEIAAHLDSGRRSALFDIVEQLGGQAFMTGTDRSLFEALGDRGQFFTVAEGKVSPC